jgi:ankyrin repeat protein
MGSTRRHKAARKSPADWEFHRKTIERLYLEERIKLDEVVKRMAKQYQFHAKYDVVYIQLCHHLLTATSKPQYERQLKEWGIRINLKASEWQDLFQILSSLPDSGQYREVRLTGQIIDADRLAREKLRRGVKDGGDISRSCPEIPKGVTFHPPLHVKLSPGASDTMPPTPEWTALVPVTYSVPLLPSSPMSMSALSNMEWQHHPISLGIFGPYAWTQAIDWSLLASSIQRNTDIARLFNPKTIDSNSAVLSSSRINNQLVIRDPEFLIPLCLLSSLLNGTEVSGHMETPHLHRVLRALPEPVIIKLFRNLESSFSDILRERVFASALESEDVDVVDAMLRLGFDPCERIWFNSGYSGGSDLPLERSLHHKKFSVCKTIVTHRCKSRPGLNSGSVQDKVLHELLDAYYQLVNPSLTSSEWEEFSNLIRISLSKGAHLTNECFFVAHHNDELANFLREKEPYGVDGWIKRGLLAARWPDTQHRSSNTREVESRYVHWILDYFLRQHRNQITREDSEVVAQLILALETAVKTRDPGAIHVIVGACTEMEIDLYCKRSEDTVIDLFRPIMEQNWASVQVLIEEYGLQDRLSNSQKCHTIDQSHFKKSQKDEYETIAEGVITGGNAGFSRAAEQYLESTDMRSYLSTRNDRTDQELFRLAIERNQHDLTATLFKVLTFDYPRRLENNWPLAYVLRVGNTAAMSAILRNSEPIATALASTAKSPPVYSFLEDLLYRRQGIFLPHLSESNASQQVRLRCICYYAIQESNGLLLTWLVDNGLDMDEYGVHLNGDVYQVHFDNMQKKAAHSGLMPNTGSSLPVHILPSLLSVAAIQSNVSMIRLLVELGAESRDSMALARAVQAGADKATVETLLQSADIKNRRHKMRHYGSAALREVIRRKNYRLLREFARHVDIDGIELLPDEMSDPRFVEPLSPLGEAILAQDYTAAEILLVEGCDPQALVCYAGFSENYNDKRSAYLVRLSPLLAAIDLGNLQIVQLLVEKGASVAPGPTQGLLRSPLQRAAEVGCFEIMKYLISRNAPVDDPPFHSGGTPLQLAARSGHERISEFLLENHADPNYPPARGDGRSAFEAAAEWGRVNIMCLLVERGTILDFEFEDNMGSQYDRALRFAEKNGHPASKRFVQKLYTDTMVARSDLSLMSLWQFVH